MSSSLCVHIFGRYTRCGGRSNGRRSVGDLLMIKRSTTSTSNDQQRQWRTRGSPRAPHFVTATLCSALKYTNTNIEKRIYKHRNRQIQKLKNTNTNNEIQKCKRRQRRKFLEEVELYLNTCIPHPQCHC